MKAGMQFPYVTLKLYLTYTEFRSFGKLLLADRQFKSVVRKLVC